MKYKGFTHILLLLAAATLLAFIFITSLAPFRNKLFSYLFPKPQSQAASPLDWPQVQYDAAHSGYIADTFGPPYTILWRKDGSSTPPAPPVSARVQPIIAYNLVFIPSNDGYLYAFKTSDGTESWKYKTGGTLVNAAAVDTTNSIVFVGSTDGKLYALDAISGALKWNYQTAGKIRVAPVVDNSTVYIANDEGVVYAFETGNDTPKWQRSVEYAVLETPAFYNGNLYVGNYASKAFALNGATGNIIWQKQLKGQGFRDRWITAGNGKVFFNPVLYKGGTVAQEEGTGVLSPISSSSWATQRQAILDYLTQKPFVQPAYILDADTGDEALAPILYSGGSTSELAQPVVLPNGNFNVIYRYTEGLPNPGCGATCYDWSLYLGEYSPTTNDIAKLDTWGGTTLATKDINKKVHIISDESTGLVRSGSILYADSDKGIVGFDSTTGNLIPFASFYTKAGGLYFSPPVVLYPAAGVTEPDTPYPYPGAEYHSDGNDIKRPTPIANGVFYILYNSTLVAVQGTKR